MFNQPRPTTSAMIAAPRPRRCPFRRDGFTLVEVLLAVGIIAILASIIAISLKTVMASSKTKATRVALENCLSLQAEYENTSKLPDSIRAKFYAIAPLTPPLQSHVVATVFAMEKLPQAPKVKEMIDRLPGGSLVQLDTTSVTVWDTAINYVAGDVVQHTPGSGVLYRARVANNGKTPGTDPEWAAIALPISTLADGWGNPIYCGGTSLELSQAYSAAEHYKVGEIVTDGTRSYKCVKTAQGVAVSDSNYWAEVSATNSYTRKAPNSRVFWVSAGPDGDLLSDDDNIYSYEN